jgi:hypothetical protein
MRIQTALLYECIVLLGALSSMEGRFCRCDADLVVRWLWEQEPGSTAADMIGSPEARSAGMMGMLSRSAGAAADKADAFVLGQRAGLLLHLDQAALIPHVVESEHRKFPYEVLCGGPFIGAGQTGTARAGRPCLLQHCLRSGLLKLVCVAARVDPGRG